MSNLFNPENKVMTFLSKLCDCMCLSLLWVVCSLPILTIGASTTALYYAVRKSIMEDRAAISQCFFGAFRMNLKQSVLLELITAGILALLSIDTYLMYLLGKAGVCGSSTYLVFGAFLIIALMWSSFVFPYAARFQDSIKKILKNTVLMLFLHFPWAVLILVLGAAQLLLILVFPFALFLAPAVFMIAKVWIFERIFKKYMPEEVPLKEAADEI